MPIQVEGLPPEWPTLVLCNKCGSSKVWLAERNMIPPDGLCPGIKGHICGGSFEQITPDNLESFVMRDLAKNGDVYDAIAGGPFRKKEGSEEIE